MSSCMGCGALLQTDDRNKVGYFNGNSLFCERCFRIKNYGDYKKIDMDNDFFVDVLKDINKTNDLVLLVLDVFNYVSNMDDIIKNISNDVLLVITKRDVIPSSFKDDKIISYFSKIGLNVLDSVVISSNKNYNFDCLFSKINLYKKSKNVYVVGFTNAGKSTMINKFIHNYSSNDLSVTTSILPSTTLNKIEILINDDLVLIDTPGLLVSNSFYNILDGKELKKIFPKNEIKPISYQIKECQYIKIDKYAYVKASFINLVMFMSNSLEIKRFYKPIDCDFKLSRVDVCNNDIVINGLGFIKCIGKGCVDVYTYDGVDVSVRDSLI